MQWPDGTEDQGSPLAANQTLMDPPFRSILIPDLSPEFEFGRNFDGEASPHEDPCNRITYTGA